MGQTLIPLFFEEVATYFPMVFDKIAINLEWYVKELESHQALLSTKYIER
jgi:hypothetical protein